MSNDVIIREIKPTDVDMIADIAVAAWKPIFDFYREAMGEELFSVACPEWQKEKARQVRNACETESSAMVCIAEKEDEVVGFITFYANNDSQIGEIGNNAVHPDFQGMGIGTVMYRHVFERLKELGMLFVKVGTGGDPAHAPARRAYEKAGFDIKIPNVQYYKKL